jgi:diguanylate cyclase (GGDEF)-like protein
MEALRAEISRLRAALRLEAQAARTDVLTNLGNRRGFNELVETLSGERFALIAFDAANLKSANTTLGHVGADRLLSRIGECIRAEWDTAFRLGGDEFAVVLRGTTNLFDAGNVRRRIERAVGTLRLDDGLSFFLAGGETVVRSGEDVSEAMDRADRAAETRKRLVKRAKGEADRAFSR